MNPAPLNDGDLSSSLYQRFLQHHVLANLTFILILAMGLLSYMAMPKEKDPSINFNWIQINTVLANASAEDIEKRITQPLEEGIAKVSDIRFISSSSRESALLCAGIRLGNGAPVIH